MWKNLMFQKIYNRINKIISFAPIFGGKGPAFFYLVLLWLFPSYRWKGYYQGYYISFRNVDLSAISEVFLDQEYNFVGEYLQDIKGPVVLDLGAHVGTFAVTCFLVNRGSNILSVEASPKTFSVLNDNVNHQKFNLKWRSIHAAVWGRHELIKFFADGGSMGHRQSDNGTVTVSTITFQDLISLVSPQQDIDLLKVDIEGAELAFLSAFPEGLRQVNALIIEIHPNLCDADAVRAILKEYFPVIDVIKGRKSSKPLLFCRK